VSERYGRNRLTLISAIALVTAVIAAGSLFVCSQRDGAAEVHVTSFTPSGEVPLSTNFTIELSKEIATDSMLNAELDRPAVEFDPPIPGKFQWVARNEIRFYPDVLLNPSTRYVASALPAIAAEHGLSLKGDRKFEFSTPRFRVNSASLAFEFSPKSKREAKLVATIEFNFEVDPAEAAKYVSVEYSDGGKIPYGTTTPASGNILSLTAESVERIDTDREIRLVIHKGLVCTGGNLGLAEDYLKPAVLPAQGNLVVAGLVPVITPPEKEYIRIEFNLPVTADDVSRFISVTPAVDHRTMARHHYLELRGDFKSGETYTVSIDKGLTAIDGSTLNREFSSAVTFVREDIPPQISFVGRGFYLTKVGNLNVGLSTINVDSVSLQIDRIFANNLVYLLNSEDLSSSDRYYYHGANLAVLGRKIDEFNVDITRLSNQEVVTPINVEGYLGSGQKGVFRLTARIQAERWRSAQKWVVATDLGMLVKRSGDDLWVWVNSLSSLAPIQGAMLTLVSQNNQELMTASTDHEGLAVFESFTRFADEFKPYLVTAAYGDDLSFLELTRRVIPTSDFEVGGQPLLQSGYEAFVYDQRGIYLPGETAHIVAIVRGAEATVPEPFPVRLKVLDPDLRILTEQRAMLSPQAAAEFDVPIPDYVKTGGYTAELLLGEKDVLGRRDFLVEEFVPDRMKVEVETNADSYQAGDSAEISVEAVTLFGPPASGRRASAEVIIEAYPFISERWKQFYFSDAEKSFLKTTTKLADATLDANGKFKYSFDIPGNVDPPASLKAVVTATVLEHGGRGVTAHTDALIHPHHTYVGLRKSEEGYAKPNAEAAHQFVVVDPDGNPVPGRRVEISLYRVYWQSVLRRSNQDGSYRYVSEMVRDLIKQFSVESTDGASPFSVIPLDYGVYVVAARDVESNASASLRFYAAGWGYSPWAMDNPDRIEIDLDKETYRPGEVAEVQLRAPFPGKLLLTVENRRILHHRIIDMSQNTATVTVQINDEYAPNVYVSAHLIRSTESLDRDTPVRAFGVVPLSVSTERSKLTVAFEAPSEIRPKTSLPVKFKVTGRNAGASYLTIAAVDEGICQLTAFETPDPHGFFFGKRRHGVESYDIYGLILPEIESSLSSTAGDGDFEATRRRQLTPVAVKRAKPIALWSGIVQTDGSGIGTVKFDIPQFNGTIRLMAAAFSGSCFGSGEQSILVREPVVLTPTFPRFIAPSDSLSIPVAVFNGTGKDSEIRVRMQAEGPVVIAGSEDKSVTVPNGGEEIVHFDLKARELMGAAKFTVTATGNGETCEVTEEVPLRPPVPFVTVSGAGITEQGRPTSFSLPSNFIEGSADFSLVLTSVPTIKFARSLQYLLGYPHGCIEQTTSKLFPLLYFDELARLAEPQLFKQNSSDYYIEEGIAKLESMQLPSGAFSFWPQGTDVNEWGSIYASHFLVEARKAGFAISDRVYDRMIKHLGSSARAYSDNDPGSYQRAIYACYVLALFGKPERNTVHFMKDNALDKIQEYSRYQLAGAFALSGDMSSAIELLPKKADFRPDDSENDPGGNFNSPTRGSAIMLDVLAQVDDRNPLVPQLIKSLTDDAESRGGMWGNTQENAFALLALGKIMSKQTVANYTGAVTVDGRPVASFDMKGGTFKSRDWAGKEVVIETQGPGICYFYWRADGLPSGLNVAEYDNDIIVRRRYLAEDGKAVNYRAFKQGDLVVAEITVKAPNQSVDNVAVVDLLPAGFEIENTRLQSRQAISWITDSAYEPAYADIRHDRLVFYGSFAHGQERKFCYALRAVTKGSFILPPIIAEAMYAPMKASVASSGRIVVSAPR
jgi:hypothetical protein